MNKRERILYYRSFLITLGIIFVGFSLCFAVVNYLRNEFIAVLPITLFFAFNLLGGYLIRQGIYSNNKKVESVANHSSKHWASVIILIVAYPVYLILSSRGKHNA